MEKINVQASSRFTVLTFPFVSTVIRACFPQKKPKSLFFTARAPYTPSCLLRLQRNKSNVSTKFLIWYTILGFMKRVSLYVITYTI